MKLFLITNIILLLLIEIDYFLKTIVIYRKI